MSEEQDGQPQPRKPVLALSMGDPNGIGLEVILKTFADPRILNFCTPVLYAAQPVVNLNRKILRMRQFHYHLIDHLDRRQPDKFNLLTVWSDEFKVQFGVPDPEVGPYAFYSLQAAVNDLQAGRVDALVTAPINKKTIQQESFSFPGHTEYLGRQLGGEPLMMMVHEAFRVAVATAHVPLRSVSDLIDEALLERKIRALDQSLRYDFGLERPRIALLGLNPHAGEQGLLGAEESEIMKPLMERLQQASILALGPYPADGFFGTGMQNQFDGILAMYHDQGLIPFKTLAFDQGVNFTAGMPAVRTSPDHGTAYALAGKNQADPTSFREAVFLAVDVWRQRRREEAIRENPLRARAEKKRER